MVSNGLAKCYFANGTSIIYIQVNKVVCDPRNKTELTTIDYLVRLDKIM